MAGRVQQHHCRRTLEKVNVVCTELCGNFRGKSCHHLPISVYAKLDEQSNKSLAKPEVFERFDPNTTCESYKLSTCSRSSIIKRSHRFVIRSLDGQTTFELSVTLSLIIVMRYQLAKLSLITPISSISGRNPIHGNLCFYAGIS